MYEPYFSVYPHLPVVALLSNCCHCLKNVFSFDFSVCTSRFSNRTVNSGRKYHTHKNLCAFSICPLSSSVHKHLSRLRLEMHIFDANVCTERLFTVHVFACICLDPWNCFSWLYCNPCSLSFLDFDVLPPSPGETLLMAEDLDPKERRLQQLKKRLEIELKVRMHY